MAIQQTNETTFAVENGRGTSLILTATTWGGWYVMSQNAATRAYNRNLGGCKAFNTLAEVEANYKAFRGIATLIASAAPAVN